MTAIDDDGDDDGQDDFNNDHGAGQAEKEMAH